MAPTMADVARVAGVHQTTVSRSLRNDPRITDEVRHKVREAAEKLGYRPNPLLSALGALRRQRATTRYQTALAFVVHQRMQGAHFGGVLAAAEQRGYKAEQFIIGDDLPESRLNTILVARNIQGIIIGPLSEAHGFFNLEWERFSTVVIEYSFTNPEFDRVVTDSYRTMNLALRHCRERGYRRIGLALTEFVDERNEGLLCAAYALSQVRDRGMERLSPHITPKWDEVKFHHWMQKQRPSVIVSSNTLLPEIELYLRKNKLRVPADIGLVNLNTTPLGQSYSGICQDAPAIGALAVRLVIEKMNHNDLGIPSSRVTVLTESHWIDGKTLLPHVEE